MIIFQAVMLDELGHEFGVEVVAASRPEAEEELEEQYPESSLVQLESPADRKARNEDLYFETAGDPDYDYDDLYYDRLEREG